MSDWPPTARELVESGEEVTRSCEECGELRDAMPLCEHEAGAWDPDAVAEYQHGGKAL